MLGRDVAHGVDVGIEVETLQMLAPQAISTRNPFISELRSGPRPCDKPRFRAGSLLDAEEAS